MLPDAYVTWLEQVRANCGHASVEKTMRIIIDFYSSFLESRPELEAPLFAGLGSHSHDVTPADQLPEVAAPRRPALREAENMIVG